MGQVPTSYHLPRTSAWSHESGECACFLCTSTPSPRAMYCVSLTHKVSIIATVCCTRSSLHWPHLCVHYHKAIASEFRPFICFRTLINRTSMPVPQQPNMRGITSSGFGSSTRGTTSGAEAAILCSIPVSHFVLDNLVIILLICGIIQYVFSGMIIWDNPVIVRCFVASYATPLT